MPRNITITFNDSSSHRYENIPDTVTPDMIEGRVQKDFPGKKITNIDGGKPATTKPVSSELNQVKKNAGLDQGSQRNEAINSIVKRAGTVYDMRKLGWSRSQALRQLQQNMGSTGEVLKVDTALCDLAWGVEKDWYTREEFQNEVRKQVAANLPK